MKHKRPLGILLLTVFLASVLLLNGSVLPSAAYAGTARRTEQRNTALFASEGTDDKEKEPMDALLDFVMKKGKGFLTKSLPGKAGGFIADSIFKSLGFDIRSGEEKAIDRYTQELESINKNLTSISEKLDLMAKEAKIKVSVNAIQMVRRNVDSFDEMIRIPYTALLNGYLLPLQNYNNAATDAERRVILENLWASIAPPDRLTPLPSKEYIFEEAENQVYSILTEHLTNVSLPERTGTGNFSRITSDFIRLCVLSPTDDSSTILDHFYVLNAPAYTMSTQMIAPYEEFLRYLSSNLTQTMALNLFMIQYEAHRAPNALKAEAARQKWSPLLSASADSLETITVDSLEDSDHSLCANYVRAFDLLSKKLDEIEGYKLQKENGEIHNIAYNQSVCSTVQSLAMKDKKANIIDKNDYSVKFEGPVVKGEGSYCNNQTAFSTQIDTLKADEAFIKHLFKEFGEYKKFRRLDEKYTILNYLQDLGFQHPDWNVDGFYISQNYVVGNYGTDLNVVYYDLNGQRQEGCWTKIIRMEQQRGGRYRPGSDPVRLRTVLRYPYCETKLMVFMQNQTFLNTPTASAGASGDASYETRVPPSFDRNEAIITPPSIPDVPTFVSPDYLPPAPDTDNPKVIETYNRILESLKKEAAAGQYDANQAPDANAITPDYVTVQVPMGSFENYHVSYVRVRSGASLQTVAGYTMLQAFRIFIIGG